MTIGPALSVIDECIQTQQRRPREVARGRCWGDLQTRGNAWDGSGASQISEKIEAALSP